MDEQNDKLEKNTRSPLSFIIWMIPILSLIITGWILYQNYTNQGYIIQIRFKNAAGIQPEKTKIKYKNIEVGAVSEVRLDDDLENVTVTAEIDKNIQNRITKDTEFWIQTAKVGIRGISGLETLLSGSYITFKPGIKEEPGKEFVGLEVPPINQTENPGTEFTLITNTLSNIVRGSGVYYKKINVGQVIDYTLKQNGRIEINVFIQSPYDKEINKTTFFWKSSAVSIDWSGSRLSLQLNTIEAGLFGGIEFDHFPDHSVFFDIKNPDVRRLYTSLDNLNNILIGPGIFFALKVNQNIKGLEIGAPIEYKGINVGKVVYYTFAQNESPEAEIIIIGSLRLSSLTSKNKSDLLEDSDRYQYDVLKKDGRRFFASVYKHGIYAEFDSQNLISGTVYIKLVTDSSFKQKTVKTITFDGKSYPLVSFKPSTNFSDLLKRSENIMKKLDEIPVQQISTQITSILKKTKDGVHSTDSMVKNLDGLVRELRTVTAKADIAGLTQSIKTQVDNVDLRLLLSEYTQTAKDMQATIQSIDGLINSNFKKSDVESLRYLSTDLIESLNEMSKSIKSLSDYIRQKPDSIIFGREE